MHSAPWASRLFGSGCRAYSATSLAVETLAHIMQHGTKDAARVAAAQALLDRGWGKATQAVEITDTSEPLQIVRTYQDKAGPTKD
jgi:hypothetical protein